MKPNSEAEIVLSDDTPPHINPINGVGAMIVNGEQHECSLPSEIPMRKGKFPLLTYQFDQNNKQCKVELTNP